MARIVSQLDTRSDAFRANAAHNRALAEELHRRQDTARHERPERDR